MDAIFEAPAMAIILGDTDALQALLDDDPTWATRRSSRSHPTLLQMIACESHQLENATESARLLLGAGADPNGPLVAAAGCDAQDVLKLILDTGAPIDGANEWSPLDEALYWCNHDIAAYLVERGATVRALSTAAGLGDIDQLATFFDSDNSLLPHAGPVASPFPETVPADLANDPASIIDHAFVMAVNAGHLPAAQWLHERRANINAKPPGYHWKGTALHAACWRGDEAMVRWLRGNGADPTIKDGLANSDAAGWANHHGHPELLPHL